MHRAEDGGHPRLTEPAAVVPGPADRESFEEAQRRHRRASWRFTALCGVAVVVMGLALSVVISPLATAVAILGTDLVNLVVPIPDKVGEVLRAVGESSDVDADAISPTTASLLVAGLLLPGGLVLLLTWVGLHSLLRKAGVGRALLGVGARDPDAAVLEERQIVNVVAEMAAAAGVPPPRVMVLDSPVANAGAVGTSLDQATIVVSTGLLETLDRDETQGVVGHLVGSVGNGDLRIGFRMASVFQTLGLISIALHSSSSASARRAAKDLLRLAFRRRARRQAVEDGSVADLLLRAETLTDDADPGKTGGLLSVLLLPVLMASGAFMMNQFVFMYMVVTPLMRRAWRARRYLADSSAVELTRNPAGLARGLLALQQRGVIPAGSEWAAHLFVVGPEVSGQPAAPARGDGQESPMLSFQPPLRRRLERLNRLGAGVELPPGPPRTAGQRGCLVVLAVVFAPLVLAVVLMLFACALALIGISLAIDMMFLFGPIVVPLHILLRGLAG